ncbi:MAG: hypothetical protein N2561_02830 [Bacteroidetes bacterium]|nr:hypothetical protein [Rhodothermia bacterium]MCS7155596.1 hypothetical protein [Bacteroidota bacterium]MCX7906454.1 hypothetical protein [Bacteroidota bacterium]MDW8137264.1 hypothetical protein [Bacteroidota bacterium]MDW8284866.1 hypothetical protein [Bacteroidota bacterium]
MRRFCGMVLLLLWLSLNVQTAQAQLRAHLPAASGVRLFQPTWLSPERFQMRHSYELSVSSLGGQALALGLYTNTLLWYPTEKLSARLDIGLLHTPFGTGAFQGVFGGRQSYARLFLQGAELTYRPSEQTLLRLSLQQFPGPMGWSWYSPYYYGYWPDWGREPWLRN